MGKVIQLKTVEYKNILTDLKETLSRVNLLLEENAINLATNGVWRKWDSEQPTGTAFNFSEAIRDTNDSNIKIIVELIDNIYFATNEFKNN